MKGFYWLFIGYAFAIIALTLDDPQPELAKNLFFAGLSLVAALGFYLLEVWKP